MLSLYKQLWDVLIIGQEKSSPSEKASERLGNMEQKYRGELCCPCTTVHPLAEATEKSMLTDVNGFKKMDAYASKAFERWENVKQKYQEDPCSLSKTAYPPCNETNEKSMLMDVNQFKELDAYASKVNVRDCVKNLVNVLIQEAHGDLEKVRAIWIWICYHIEYDVESLRGKTKTSLEPKDILQSGKTICAGYARLFEEMCRIAGIHCKTLSGTSNRKGPDFKKNKRHSWNAVYLDGKWHLLDSTWGSGFVDGDKFTFSHKEFYFLTHPDLFVENHIPDDPKWQLQGMDPATI